MFISKRWGDPVNIAGHPAWGMGHRAWGMGHKGMGHWVDQLFSQSLKPNP